MEANFEGSFLDWLRQHSPGVLSLQEVAHFIRQAAKAIQDLHNHRIVHQNVTPSSFLVRGNSQAPNLPNLQLVDPEKARPSPAIAGTPTIMAPEQWRGVAVPATDQYALAIMAYWLLTQHSPFLGTREQLMHQHLYVQPQPPSILNHSIPPTLDTVILRALSKRPEDRYPSITAFAEAFQQALLTPNSMSMMQIQHSFNTSTSSPAPTGNIGSKSLNARTSLASSPLPNLLKELFLLGIVFLAIVSSIGFGFFFLIRSHESTAAKFQPTVQAEETSRAITSTSAASSNNSVILIDGLSNNAYGWWQVNPSCLFTRGTYHVFVQQADSIQGCQLKAPLVLDNAAIQVDVSLLSGDDAGLMFRQNDQKYYDFEFNNQGEFFFRRYDSAETGKFFIKPQKTSALAAGKQKNRLLVVAKGDDFKLYINGVFVGEVHDGTYTSGMFAFVVGTFAPTSSGEASFSNLKVFKL